MSGSRAWGEDLFGCFDDFGTCLCGSCCTPCLFGQNVEKINGDNCCLWCCAYGCLFECYLCWLPHYFKRQELRQKYDLQEDPTCNDILATLCCGPCAICQEARFLNRQAGQSGAGPQMVQPGRKF